MTFLGPGSFAFMGTFQIPLYDKHDNVVAHATVDEQDFARLSHLRFTALRTKSGIYGVQFRAVNGSTEATLLHRLVLGDPPFDGAEVDHRNRNTLDTRRENLRWVTHAQNLQNRPSQKNATSAHRGGSAAGPLDRAGSIRPLRCFDTTGRGRYNSGHELARAHLGGSCRAEREALHPRYADHRVRRAGVPRGRHE